MCGILYQKPVHNFDNLLNSMHHRGPDHTRSVEVGDIVAYGTKRLAIQDLDPRANQPFELEKHELIFNGEIYNFKELITEHSLPMLTTSDTEVVLRMYLKYGPSFLQYLNGMFAMVIVDHNTDQIFVARDRLGIKPLYWYQDSKGLMISSEIAPIVAHFNPDLDPFAIRQYRKLRMCVNGDTLYKDVKMFPAAHYYHNNKLHQYWDVDITPKESPRDEELIEMLQRSIDYRMISDVPVGSYLSGGLDSTIITHLSGVKRSWDVGTPLCNEHNWARLACKLPDLRHTSISFTNDRFLSTLEEMVKIRKESLSVPNEVLLYLLSKEVKEECTVMLSGEGADELFMGYDRIFTWARNNDLTVEGFDRMYSYGSQPDNEVIEYALSTVKGNTTVEKMTYYFLTNHLQGLLRRLDNSTMMASIESRVPFLDHNIVDRIAGAPVDWKMDPLPQDNPDPFDSSHQARTPKAPLKRAFTGLIPHDIILRKKVGFPVPLDQLFPDGNGTPMDRWLDKNLELLCV